MHIKQYYTPRQQPARRLEEKGGAEQLQHRQHGRDGEEEAPPAIDVLCWLFGWVGGR